MIKTFADKRTAAVFLGKMPKGFPADLGKRARKQLLVLNESTRLEDLRLPPSNRLERLKGRRRGEYSIRVNRQWRICFRWYAGDAFNVEISDYH